ncbi:hypothetical protein I6E68_06495 [Salinibacterium sp. NSLL150]|uniref:hypothetical protein n=1 Tax=unclassified Salinibacterium TaxID=2632331 RepID=UPI0018CE4895|nr:MULTISPECIES: hypothetical protein [unclassified Salinibacterium]MBH0098785.1 hypothetical protein [Salinibacterium sp. NSLL35]MBH0101540.1 hypothetical protein [Salinibacterium sp. NSLL150]MBH0104299.1 hypothetical protein [Salinibacterium sp. NSLL16]MBH0107060.1 hypothetical protein [Salinibacterium sp. NSLL17]
MMSSIGAFAMLLNLLFAAAVIVLFVLVVWTLILSIKALRKYLGQPGPSSTNLHGSE